MSGSSPPRTPGGRARLVVAAVLFVGWLGWLGYTALTRSRAPVVSHAQAAVTTVAVVAELTAGEDGRQILLFRRDSPIGPQVVDLKEKADRPAIAAKVVEVLKGGPAQGASIAVTNLPDCAGYTGPGTYLLLLTADADGAAENLPAYALAGPRSPGADAGPPRIYPWSDATAADLRKQVEKLIP